MQILVGEVRIETTHRTAHNVVWEDEGKARPREKSPGKEGSPFRLPRVPTRSRLFDGDVRFSSPHPCTPYRDVSTHRVETRLGDSLFADGTHTIGAVIEPSERVLDRS
jgi:hypothetical protein